MRMELSWSICAATKTRIENRYTEIHSCHCGHWSWMGHLVAPSKEAFRAESFWWKTNWHPSSFAGSIETCVFFGSRKNWYLGQIPSAFVVLRLGRPEVPEGDTCHESKAATPRKVVIGDRRQEVCRKNRHRSCLGGNCMLQTEQYILYSNV